MAPKKPSQPKPLELERLVTKLLDTNKAENIVIIDLAGKSDFADKMVVASGTSQRHVAALAEHVVTGLKKAGFEHVPVEGKKACDWVLVDAGNLLIHIFRPETRGYYNLEKMWAVSLPQAEAAL